MATFFSDYFEIDPDKLHECGAFNISLITDLPLFIDPFLLFNSKKAEYQSLHDGMIRYLVFLRDKAIADQVDPHLLKAWYCFPEVSQTWLGFTQMGNKGTGLGLDFARALHSSLYQLFPEFGSERVTRGSHLEKVCLIKDGVGRDNISDFTTNLIKAHLYDFTEKFALANLRPEQRRKVSIGNVTFNYETEVWEPREFTLPWIKGDHVVLTPKDILTRDENWINKHDLVHDFERLPEAVPDQELRAQINNYFAKVLPRHPRKGPTQREKEEAALRTIAEFPQVIDYYILDKENRGAEATSVSAEKVRASEAQFNFQVRELQRELRSKTPFYESEGGTYEEAHQRLAYLKDVIENKGGHRAFYKSGKPIGQEKDLQIMYRLVWFGSPSDVSTEVNDGRGPADFKISRGASDKTIVEMKLARNSQLQRNLAKQTEIYQAASDARNAIKAILYFSYEELERVRKILTALSLEGHKDIVLIDARIDNKPSASKA